MDVPVRSSSRGRCAGSDGVCPAGLLGSVNSVASSRSTEGVSAGSAARFAAADCENPIEIGLVIDPRDAPDAVPQVISSGAGL